jgi:phosphate transport system substrate-binding protein
MKRYAVKFFCCFSISLLLNGITCAADELAGAGSSAAAPVYRIWAQEYKKNGGDSVSYDPVGSGAGMTKIRQRQADFGASDVIASKADLSKDGLVMFPTVISGVVPVVNLPKLSAPIRLDGETLARIFLGEITLWNAPEIAALNPRLSLPSLPIKVICRGDGSGTTYHFSDYLSKVSPTWKTRFGIANKHAWPQGFVAVTGSGEVSKTLRNTAGGISYIDYNYVLDDNLTPLQLKTASGRYITASPEVFRSAVIGSRWFTHGDFSQTLTNIPGDNAWPITMGTYAAIPKVASDTARAARTLRFFAWAYGHGDQLAGQAKFVPLPEKVQASAYREIASVVGSKGELIGVDALGAMLR